MKAPRVSGERQAGQSSLREDTGEAAEAAEADVLVDAAVVVSSMNHTPSSSAAAPRGGGVDAFRLTVNDHTNAPIATTEAKRKSRPPPESTSVCRSLRMRARAGSDC